MECSIRDKKIFGVFKNKLLLFYMAMGFSKQMIMLVWVKLINGEEQLELIKVCMLSWMLYLVYSVYHRNSMIRQKYSKRNNYYNLYMIY